MSGNTDTVMQCTARTVGTQLSRVAHRSTAALLRVRGAVSWKCLSQLALWYGARVASGSLCRSHGDMLLIFLYRLRNVRRRSGIFS